MICKPYAIAEEALWEPTSYFGLPVKDSLVFWMDGMRGLNELDLEFWNAQVETRLMGYRNDLPALEAIIPEQIQAICVNQRLSVPLNCGLTLSIAFIAKNDVSETILIAWLITTLLINALRLIWNYRQSKALLQGTLSNNALHLSGLLMLLTGVVWSLVPALMFDITNSRAPYILFTLAGLSAGAMAQAGTYSLGAVAFVVPLMGTLAVKMIWSGGWGGCPLAFDCLLYLALLCLSARKNEEAFVKTVLLRVQATTLAASLDKEHTASKAAAARFFNLANHDPLTGLANRAAFSTNLGSWLARAREDNSVFYLFLLDLDHFKSINDTLGHSAGDEVLKEAARRLTATIEGDHVVARLGGDEFLILFAQPAGSDATSSDEDIGLIADHILSKVSGELSLGEQSISIGVSLGVAKFPDDGVSAEDLLAHADLALYAAKDGGRHRWRRFDAGLLADATMARDVEHDLPAALAAGAMEIFYQPQVALDDFRLVGLEGLLRWQHPVHGWIAPSMVVAAARRIRKSNLLTAFILDDACHQLRRLSDEGLPDVLVAVNISPNELDIHDLPALVQRSIVKHGIDCGRLEVEITEEAFAASENGLATLRALSTIGVRIAIDDFGTGYSSIAYLHRMHVDRIKIDRSFVTGFSDRDGDRILVKAILGIGRSFGIEVIAEGVETAEEALLLRAFGCGVVQGFHFSRPLNRRDLDAWMTARGDKPQLRESRIPVSPTAMIRADVLEVEKAVA